MNKLRENTGVILWILVFAFGVIWVLQDSGGLDVVGNTAGVNVITVNGDAITYDEYVQALDAQMQSYQQQNNESMPPQMLDQERERIFNALVEDKLREQEMDRIGITVTDEEVLDMVLGPNPHPIITIYFGDGQGGVNQELLRNFIDNPDATQEWIQIENYLRAERRRQKLNSLIAASVRVSDQDVLDEYMKRNLRANAEWVGLRYASIPDDSIQVTDRDLRSFYDEHREDFARERTYRINYVLRSKEPSAEDSVQLRQDLERLRTRFAQAEDDSLFLARNASERPFSGAWFRADELQPELSSQLFPSPQPGTVVGPVFAGDEVHLVKVLETRAAEEEAVRARHILLRTEGTNDEEVRAQAERLKQRIEAGESFAQLAAEFSADGTAQRGGDLGWFGRGRMVEPFENAAFGAEVGQVVGPVKTQFGFHLIEVTDRADEEVRVADFTQRVRADVATLNAVQEQLEDLRYFGAENDDFQGEAQRLGLTVQTVDAEQGQQFIPGIGTSRALQNFLAGAEEGSISEVIELDDAFMTAQVAEVTPEGYRPFEEVKAELEPRVRTQKKQQLQVDRLQRALDQHGFEGLAQALGVQQYTATGIQYNAPVVANLGREPKFIGTALGLDADMTSEVIAGENIAFVLKVTSRNEPAPIMEATRQQIHEQLLSRRRQQVQNEWIAALREQADIEDNRRRFEQ